MTISKYISIFLIAILSVSAISMYLVDSSSISTIEFLGNHESEIAEEEIQEFVKLKSKSVNILFNYSKPFPFFMAELVDPPYLESIFPPPDFS